MRRTFARRAAVLGSAAVLLFGPAAAIAQAEPAPVQTTDLPAELVEALQRDLQISPERFLDDATRSQELARFAETAREKFEAVFAGVWLDQAGTPTVGLTEGDQFDEARDAAVDEGFTVVETDRSEDALNDKLEALNDWLETQPPAVADVIRGIAVDVVNNDVVVRADNVAGIELPDFLRDVRVLFAPAELTPEPALDLRPVAGIAAPDALFGGDAYASLGAGEGLRCSLGFNAEDGSGNPVNITAGHCDPNRAQAGTQWASEVYQLVGDALGQRLGTFEKTSLDNHDYGLIRPSAEAAGRFENNGVRVPAAAPLPITGTADPIVGTPVCKSGLRTGYSCGVVTSTGQSIEIGHRVLRDGFATNLCALQGDSGGTLVVGTLALGISSASNVGQYGFCEVAGVVSGLLGESPELFATPINVILDENPGLKIRTW
ncbi:S1 family peptidase [Rhodococcus chondri]|uniref:S1 family peptidase n=1 Tax=Rhodococcus chondri TaxID=3065941 RepID=A0ABU7JWB7_9NOCA|nr:S1 family peptidase [Rhodococcus sp. CC-R104]MEE2034305.1 S1 family peptidase [Rhodococcus sp. CC-R104]